MARILVVEDVEELAEELERAVGPGHSVFCAGSRTQALRALEEEVFDLVVTALVLETGDYNDGVSVVRAARQKNPVAQTILVCSYSTPEACREAIRAGVFDYIERNSPGIDFYELLRWKIALALYFGGRS